MVTIAKSPMFLAGVTCLPPPQVQVSASRPSREDECEQVFLDHRDDVDGLVEALAKRYSMSKDDLDDFRSSVYQKLIEDDYAVLRKHRGESTVRSYLSAVIANHLRDLRVKRWGRWRPSAVALRAGPAGVLLERLMHRDGYSFDAAVEALRSRGFVEPSLRDLIRLSHAFAGRQRARIESDSEAVEAAPGSERADQRVRDQESTGRRQAIVRALEAAMESFGTEDQLLLKLRFWNQLSIADIARCRGLKQRPLYRTFERLLGRLREHLEESGISASEVREYFDEEFS